MLSAESRAPRRCKSVPKTKCHCSSGASGGANKGPAVIDKRNQVLECPHCDRTFQQVQRYREHIAKKHAEEQAAASADQEPEAVSNAAKV